MIIHQIIAVFREYRELANEWKGKYDVEYVTYQHEKEKREKMQAELAELKKAVFEVMADDRIPEAALWPLDSIIEPNEWQAWLDKRGER